MLGVDVAFTSEVTHDDRPLIKRPVKKSEDPKDCSPREEDHIRESRISPDTLHCDPDEAAAPADRRRNIRARNRLVDANLTGSFRDALNT